MQMGMNSHLLGQENDCTALRLIHDFGWLRAPEIGLLIWGAHTHHVKYGERLLRKLAARHLVIPRPLPAHSGSAFVLSQRGADLLLETTGITARSGKDWGETQAGVWVVPKWWRHDLLAHSFLALLSSQGYTVIPERRLRRENAVDKLPDGLAIPPDKGDVFWVEIESTRKSGRNMDLMARALIKVALGKAPTLSRLKANQTMVCYADRATDERGYRLDHRARVVNALQRHAPGSIAVCLYKLSLKGLAVTDFSGEVVTITPDVVKQRLHQWRALWCDATENLDGGEECIWQGRLLSVWQKQNTLWGWQVEDTQRVGEDGYPLVLEFGEALTRTAAEEALAALALWD
jgi:hypothetical protein